MSSFGGGRGGGGRSGGGRGRTGGGRSGGRSPSVGPSTDSSVQRPRFTGESSSSGAQGTASTPSADLVGHLHDVDLQDDDLHIDEAVPETPPPFRDPSGRILVYILGTR
jgi:hypothetical protein